MLWLPPVNPRSDMDGDPPLPHTNDSPISLWDPQGLSSTLSPAICCTQLSYLLPNCKRNFLKDLRK